MDKIFFSEDNENKILCLLKSKGFGLGLNGNEIINIIKPRMIHVYNKYGDKNISLEQINSLVIGHFIKNIPSRLPSPIRVRKNEKMSQEHLESFVSNRNKFDVSIGLKPMQVKFMKPEIENSKQTKKIRKIEYEEDEVDPLDAYFNLL
jgi:hypothetical protein